MDFVYKDGIGADAYNRLRDAVGWERIHTQQAAAGLANSEKVLCCYAENRLAGSAKVLWDGG